LLWALEDAPAGLDLRDAGATVVLHEPKHLARRGRPRGTRGIRLSAELSLPRAWTRVVSRLGLPLADAEAWEELRQELAVRQGTADGDAPGLLSVHRLAGYPDERHGLMPSACEAGARGIDLGSKPAYEHPMAGELEAASERWRLLFQLSLDGSFGWDWGAGRERLYVWIAADDLARADFSKVWGVTQ
jgi:Domain of unknown function (DUF1963)